MVGTLYKRAWESEPLLEAHEKLQKLNQCLEEKLLKLAEERQAETTQLSNQIQDLTQRLVEARLYIHQLEDENEDCRWSEGH
ncbi:unnamed protein product [Allacma fusca]|uniref:Uncharacterized protein n=1 Tax=Allacma fusca TaxID=39272 RepID=A0A8J2L2Y5_9HEXA|nr:unnamed protein product [Allacma fusca]